MSPKGDRFQKVLQIRLFVPEQRTWSHIRLCLVCGGVCVCAFTNLRVCLFFKISFDRHKQITVCTYPQPRSLSVHLIFAFAVCPLFLVDTADSYPKVMSSMTLQTTQHSTSGRAPVSRRQPEPAGYKSGYLYQNNVHGHVLGYVWCVVCGVWCVVCVCDACVVWV